MGCLTYKKSKLNALKDLKDKGIIDDNRKLLDKTAYGKYLEDNLGAINRAYNLNLDNLFNIKEDNVSKSIRPSPYYRTDTKTPIERVVPDENSFNQIDGVRKELGIYETKESIGEYRKRQKEKPKENLPTNEISFILKSIDILNNLSNKQKQLFNSLNKNRISPEQLVNKLQIPKEHKPIVIESINNFEEKITLENLALELANKYSFTVEINTAKGRHTVDERMALLDESKEEQPSQYYSNLTVPGGNNYTENEIRTPAITPSIKGHAQFSTHQGIGWFRSDDKVKGKQIDTFSAFAPEQGYSEQSIYDDNTSTSTRRILELQSDLFQKGRDKRTLTKQGLEGSQTNFYDDGFHYTYNDGKFYKDDIEITREDAIKAYDSRTGKVLKETNENQFLQLLNKNNNWVTFFIKSIVQDSAKKGYEKVLFPKGDTASKIEGHQTLEEFKRQKEDRIKELEENRKNLKNLIGKKFDEDAYNAKVAKFIDEAGYNPEDTGEISIADFLVRPDRDGTIISQELLGRYDRSKREIAQLKQELADVESGQTQLSSIAKFYEETVTNILKKQGYNPIEITDEYGNDWNKVTITPEMLSPILLKKEKSELERSIPTEALKSLNIKLTGFLSGLGVSVEASNDMKSRTGYDALGMADFVRKTIILAEGKEDIALPEETAHFAIKALGLDHPLVKRAMAMVEDTPTYREVEREYSETYNENKELLKEEAVGKLLAETIISKESDIELSKGKRNLLQRLWDAFLSIFKGQSPVTIENMIKESFGDIADSILKGEMSEFSLENLKKASTDPFYKLNVDKFKEVDLIQDNIRRSVFEKNFKEAIKKRISVLERHKFRGGEGFSIKAKKLIEELEELRKSDGITDQQLKDKNTVIGIVKFTNQLETELKGLKKRYNDIVENPEDRSLSEKAKTLKSMADFVSAYDPIIKNIVNNLRGDKLKEAKKLRKLLNKLNRITDDVNSSYKDQAITIFADALEPFAKKNPAYNREDFEDMLRQSPDITIVRRWLDSMAESRDDTLGIIDRIVKEHREKAQIETDTIIKELVALDQKLKSSGIENTEWIYERDENGNPTGYMIMPYNWGKYYSDEKTAKVKAKKGLDLEDAKDLKIYRKRMSKWYKENTEGNPDVIKTVESKIASFYKQFITDKYKKEEQKEFVEFLKNARFYPENLSKAQKEQYDYLTGREERKDTTLRDRQEKKVFEEFQTWWDDQWIQPKDPEFQDPVPIRDLAVPKTSIYGSKEYQEIRDNKLKSEYYDRIIALKEEIDDNLPHTMTDRRLAPQIRKDAIERGIKQAKESIRDIYIRRSDDIAFGAMDENGHPIDFLPIFFTKKLRKQAVDEKGNPLEDEQGNPIMTDDTKDLSMDMTASMARYIAMGKSYKEMSKVIDILQMGEDILSERTIETDTKNILSKTYDIFTGEQGKKVKKGGNSYDRFKDYMDMIVYGHIKADEGVWKLFGNNVDKAKVTDAFTQYTAINNLALNIYAGLANPVLGNALIRQESIAGEYVKKGALTFADKVYASQIGGILGDMGSAGTTNKLRLFLEKYDLMQDYSQRLHELNLDRNRFGRMINISSLFFINHIGEHQMQSRMALAMAFSKKFKDKNGEEINLWDALEVEELGSGIGDIKLREGVVNLDGSKIKGLSDSNIMDFSIKTKAINKRLHGIYNEADRNALQKYSLGRMVMLFRKFLKPGFNRRWDMKYFNYELGHEIEGSYQTFYRFMGNLLHDLKQKQFSIAKSFNELSDREKANIKRASTEFAYMLGTWIIGGILTNLAGDDDDDWQLNMAAYQANRLFTELSFNINLYESFRILENPAATVSQMEDMFRVFKSVDPTGATFNDEPFFREYVSGDKRGDTYIKHRTLELIPLYRSLNKGLTPNEQLKFFTK